MSKRSASSPVDEHPEPKKSKLDVFETELGTQQPQEEQTDNQAVPNTDSDELKCRQSVYAYTFMAELRARQPEPLTEGDTGKVGTKAGREPSKASQNFRPWRPAVADEPIPLCQAHWGVIPRPGDKIPDVDQPPAYTSDGAVEPPLWQDLKGGVRVKKGSRFIRDYDQAYHLHIRLMNLRPVISKLDQRVLPKRQPITYMCEHGMPDWSNSGAVSVVNKGIQDQIRKNSNEEPWSREDRETLAAIFREQPEISLLEASRIFNARAYPLEMQKAESYPIGRFTESIQHEYRIYKAAYDKGQAPVLIATEDTSATKRNIPLGHLYAEWNEGKKIAVKAAKKAAIKMTKNAENDAEIKSKGEGFPRKKKSDTVVNSSGKMRKSDSIKKPPRFRKGQESGFTPEQIALMDANARATADALNANGDLNPQVVHPAKTAIPIIDQPTQSEGSETPRIPQTQAEVASSDVPTVKTAEEIQPAAQASRAEPASVVEEIEGVAEAAVGHAIVKDAFVFRAARDIEIDEDYSEDVDL